MEQIAEQQRTTPITDTQLVLPDGRRLGYAEYGDPNGTPMFFIHGSPGSRLWLGDDSPEAHDLSVRVITTDRPGYGLSDPQPDRTLLGWADDIAALADHLGIDRFAIVGVSAGAVHAAACAYKLRQRVTLAVLLSTPPPPELPDGYVGMSRINRLAFLAGKYAPPLVRLGTSISAALFHANPHRYMRLLALQMDPPDRQFLRHEQAQRDQIRRYNAAYRQGEAGHTEDIVLISQPWGFDVREIRVPVHLWHGDHDTVIPVRDGQKVARLIPDCRVRLLPQTGHLVAEQPDYWHDLLRLVAETRSNGLIAS